MSYRGGRGGRGGGPMAFSMGNPDLKPDFTPSERYPKTIVPVQSVASTSERQAVAQFLKLRDDIRDGPLYVGSTTKRGRVVVEIEQSVNDGIKRYTDRYIKKRKIGRSIDEHPYVTSFFPNELHSAMAAGDSKKIKKLDVTKFTSDLLDLDSGADESKSDKTSLLALKFSQIEEDEKEGSGSEVDEDEDEEDEEKDEFEEDEDDDYNAEKYFDDGDGMDNGDDDDGEAAY